MSRITSLLFLAVVCLASAAPLLSNTPLDLFNQGVLRDGILNGFRGLGADECAHGLLGGLLGVKGIAVTAAYHTKVYVHADISSVITIDIPTVNGLLSSVEAIVGRITTIGNILGKSDSTTTVLAVKAKADVEVTLGVVADIEVALPANVDALFTQNLIFAKVQIGVSIDLSADVDVAATLISPVLNLASSLTGSVGCLRLDQIQKTWSVVPTHYDSQTGRVAVDLSHQRIISGIYIFVNIKAEI
ncbi:hypothetical protein PROFUN_06235 [Planoprotostelium fungivorum]|uniref:Lipid-binding serum glycoprotein N-terminal domain-containing protein n=1 Tax=Planoprotostelium fungivorum TaxID=1890364 RepID=A0A2P6NE26_9EUKA|nr:hypothetical protein PROFUN_06235 [Planoprotostelium fungivorum]